ncbi:MAG: hypothetical protein WCK05_03310 [Planctomycetota bacterium]
MRVVQPYPHLLVVCTPQAGSPTGAGSGGGGEAVQYPYSPPPERAIVQMQSHHPLRSYHRSSCTNSFFAPHGVQWTRSLDCAKKIVCLGPAQME